MPSLSLSHIGPYTVQSQLGRGALASVYLAHDTRLDRSVVVKVLDQQLASEPDLEQRFLSEVRQLARLRHPNIVSVLDFGTDENRLYVVLEYMSGGTLKDRLRDGAPPVPEAVRILDQIGAALEYAHSQGIIHRDVRPANILFDQAGVARLSDFGLARLAQARSTQTTGVIIGSPAYMSPEQALGDGTLDARSDIYALGAVTFELLTGRLPYPADSPIAVILRQVSDPIPRLADVNPNLPSSLQQVLDKAMAKRREDRFGTAREFVQALDAAIRDRAQRPGAERREAEVRYVDFDLALSPSSGRGYLVQVVSSPAGEAQAEFMPPFSDLELENAVLQLGRAGRGSLQTAKMLGQRLFEAVFTGPVRSVFEASLSQSQHDDSGLRIKLRLARVPELAALPWEYLFEPGRQRFLALSSSTPIVRYADTPTPVRPVTVDPPLRVLALITSPPDLPPLDVAAEKQLLQTALKDSQERGLLQLDFLRAATLNDLQHQLRVDGPYHILHYVGHAGLDDGDGWLFFEDEDGAGRSISAESLGSLLADVRSLAVVTLSASATAIAPPYPALAVAAKLVQSGVPAVLARTFEMDERSSLELSQVFYEALAGGRPVDLALAEARKSTFAIAENASWGAPVLYQRTPDGRVFTLVTAESRLEVRAQRVAVEVERTVSVQRANERVAETLVELSRFNSLDDIASTPRRLDWLPEGLIRELDLDIVETLPGLLAIAKDIAAAQQLDVYGRRLAWHRALEGLDQLLKQLPVLGERAERWNALLAAWQATVLRAIEALQAGAEGARVPNPYLAGNPLQLAQKALFKGRRDLRDAVVNALLEKTRPTLVLQGPRRMGKTSFLLQLPALLPGKTIPVFVDLQKASATVSDSAFLYEMARAISAAAKRYQVIIPVPDRTRLSESLYETFDGWVDQTVLPGLGDFKLLLTFDEFEKVGEALRSQRLTRQVLDELRHTIQHRSQMALLFAGVQSLDELGPDWSSYFINVRALTMGYLSRVEAEDLIRRPDPGIPFGLEYTAGAVERIAQSTLGHPYLVQLVCSAIVEAANERGVRQADEPLVAAGEALALERGEPYFRNLWDEAAGAAGQPLLRRIAAAARAVSIRADSAAAQQALERMQRHGVIVRRKPGLALLRAHDPYQVEVPLVRRWIRERAPA